jgi:hypothetical protein
VAFQPLLTFSDPFVLGALAINLGNSESAEMVCLGHFTVVEGSAGLWSDYNSSTRIEYLMTFQKWALKQLFELLGGCGSKSWMAVPE